MTYDLYDELPRGQERAVRALVSHDVPWGRTYREAAEAADMSLGTLYTHLRRVRKNHPKVYARIREIRSRQLAARHENAVFDRRLRSRQWWSGVNRSIYSALYAVSAFDPLAYTASEAGSCGVVGGT